MQPNNNEFPGELNNAHKSKHFAFFSRRESLQQALSSRRNSSLIQEQQSIPVLIKNDSRRSSLNIIDKNDEQLKHKSDSTNKEIRTSAKHKQEHTSSIDKQQKSSSTLDKNNKHRSSFPRRSEQQSKRNSNLITDETIVTPIIIDSSKTRQNNDKVNYSSIFSFLN